MRRTGYEPTQARSPLRLRLGLALFGLLSGIGAAVGFAVYDQPGWAGLCGAIAAVAAVDCAVVIRHMRQGAHYQPGRGVPPYLPIHDDRPADTADHGDGRNTGRGRRGGP